MDKKEYRIFLQDVYHKYPAGRGRIKTVLRNIDLAVRESEFLSVVGPTGCGKSTLLRLILGSEQPTGGQLLIDGETISGPDRNRGVVFQRYSLFSHLTVIQNIVLGLELEKFNLAQRVLRTPAYKKSRKEFNEAAFTYIKHIGLQEDDAEKYPHQLSGGMRQRVAIAQSLILKPKILLMDEPHGALDEGTRQAMQVFISQQWEREKLTIIFVTHDLEEALFLGTRVIVLSQYYSGDSELEGSMIVADRDIPPPWPKPTDFKYTPLFNQYLSRIREEGLDPLTKQHVRQFDLSHQDSFRTLGIEECKLYEGKGCNECGKCKKRQALE